VGYGHRSDASILGKEAEDIMIKQIAAAATVVAIGVLAVGSSSSAGQSASTSSQRHTFTVVEVETESSFVDLGEEGFNMGDEGAVWTANLRWDGKVVGHDSGVCFVTSDKIPAAQCSITAQFGKGQISLQIVNDLTSARNVGVITGGTGAYEGAAGEVRVRFIPDRGVHRLTFDFTT
jgi:hypothetical protein